MTPEHIAASRQLGEKMVAALQRGLRKNQQADR